MVNFVFEFSNLFGVRMSIIARIAMARPPRSNELTNIPLHIGIVVNPTQS